MGYVVLHIDKALGSDSGMSSHIERKINPTNADEERTHLNKELVEFSESVANRTEAIQHRLDTAGLTRKIGTNQVRALRMMLSGSPEDMQRIRAEGKLDQWCADNLAWLRKTYGEANVVSAVLHMDETTPHIHATVVPIVTGERRKAAQERSKSADSTKKKYRKKKADAPRLCADDVMARDRLKGYQDSYAEAMFAYGLQRGIDGSEARHITNIEYARTIVANKQAMENEIDHLALIKEAKRLEAIEQEQLARQAKSRTEQALAKAQQAEAGQQQAESRLADTCKELSREKVKLTGQKLKNTAAEAGAKIADGIGAMFSSSKAERKQQEIDSLKAENAGLTFQLNNKDIQIRNLISDKQSDTERLKYAYENQIDKFRRAELAAKAQHQQQIESISKWFPGAPQLAEMAEYCKTIGCSDDITRTLITGKPVKIAGVLNLPEHNKRFDATGTVLRIERHSDNANRFRLTINGTDVVQWFKQKFEELQQKLGITPRQTHSKDKGRGI